MAAYASVSEEISRTGQQPPKDNQSAQELAPDALLRTVIAPDFSRQIETLRTRIGELERELTERESAEASIRLEISGDNGGIWFLNVHGGRMEVGATPTMPVLFSLHQGADDWHAFTHAGTMLGPAKNQSVGTRGGILTPSRIARLQAVTGTIQIVLTGTDDGTDHSVTLHFGSGKPASPPEATVSMRVDDARRLREGSLDPQTAFLQGLVKIGGDMGIAVRLGTALFM